MGFIHEDRLTANEFVFIYSMKNLISYQNHGKVTFSNSGI
jgi:hypothetical protein